MYYPLVYFTFLVVTCNFGFLVQNDLVLLVYIIIFCVIVVGLKISCVWVDLDL